MSLEDFIEEQAAMNPSKKFVFLTPDDILTLRLLRDDLIRETLGNARTYEDDRRLQTLERILKQVG